MCECRARIDEKLKTQNARLAFGFTCVGGSMGLSPPMIMLEKIGGRGKRLPTLLATYCPFCGERCEPEKDLPDPEFDEPRHNPDAVYIDGR